MSIWDGEIFVVCLLYGKEREKEKKKKYSRCKILSKNYLLGILFKKYSIIKQNYFDPFL
jgi:hypothetical protein